MIYNLKKECYICSYMTKLKSQPIGIRFDLQKLEFIKGAENLPTPQQVVNFLMEEYWWKSKGLSKHDNEIRLSPFKPTVKIKRKPEIIFGDSDKPIKEDGEDTFAYLRRVAIWKDSNGY